MATSGFATSALCNVLAWTRRVGFRQFSSNGGREFYQRINEQYLAKELENISTSGRQGKVVDPGLFDPKVRLRPNRRPMPSLAAATAAAEEFANEDAGRGGSSSSAGGFPESRKRTKPWLHYESLRGSTFPSGGTGPRWQDLTHAEAQRLQEMYMRKRMLDRKILWLKQQELPNPQREAKMSMRQQKRQEEEAKDAGNGGDMYPPPFIDTHPGNRRLQRMEDSARQEELESRFRARIREQKLENARILKANQPNVGDLVTDPIKRHVGRRLVRQRVKIHAGLEDILTQNTAQILCEFLQGVSVSIVRVRAKAPRETQEIQYNLSSDHDPEWVQKQLNVLAPKLRSQLALKVNMGQTPNIRFVPFAKSQEVKRKFLWKYAKAIQDQTPVGGGFGSAVNTQ
eukprot:TRINITY_DN15531_c0_g1_i1.p1 TRINITY_DN15531_c0_g1~~TRINITY_DN15531_c0_g1_i1.p1  ORF type:complete len:406 (+),score=86.83 TRINITY_DN15531_c0_g1_i1:24-1220(+)